MKFGISFTLTYLNQAGALVHVYQDGSIHLNHGGTEMGQGLNQKVAQVVAGVFGVDAGSVKITATDTGKVPNTSATAASSGSDMNGMAVQRRRETIRDRMADLLAEKHQAAAREVSLSPMGRVQVGGRRLQLCRGRGDGLSGAGLAVLDRLLRARPRSPGTGSRARAARSSTLPMARP